jgi:hypothetical protein
MAAFGRREQKDELADAVYYRLQAKLAFQTGTLQ